MLGATIVQIPMAVWAQRHCILNRVFAAVYQLQRMMHFEIRSAVLLPKEWRRLSTSFAHAGRTSQYFDDYVLVSIENVSDSSEFPRKPRRTLKPKPSCCR
jgi:hypothetical protein